MRITRGILTALLMAAVAMSPLAAVHALNIFAADGIDPRVRVMRSPSTPFTAIGVTENINPIKFKGETGQYRGTGFLISPCLIMTSHHLIFGDALYMSKDEWQSFAIHFYVGGIDPEGFGFTSRGVPVAKGIRTSLDEDDWVIVKLDTCLGANPLVGWLSIADQYNDELVGARVNIAAYPGDKPFGQMWVQSNCLVRGEDAKLNYLTHDCATVPGMSGAPIYRLNAKAEIQVIAINKGARVKADGVKRGFTDASANLAINIGDILADPAVAKMIKDDAAAFRLPLSPRFPVNPIPTPVN